MFDNSYTPQWRTRNDTFNPLTATCLASLPTDLPTEWLWRNVLPRGHLTLLAGPPSRAKSFLALDIAARVSRGRPMPSFPSRDPLAASRSSPPHGCCEPAHVLLLTSEDSLQSVILSRLRSLNADLNYIHAVDGESRDIRLADDVTSLHRLLVGFAPRSPALIIIDTLPIFLASEHPLNVRRAMLSLSSLADACGTAILAITHTAPRPARRAPRLVGSFYYSSAARLIWHCDFAPPHLAAAPREPNALEAPRADPSPLFALSLLKSNLPIPDITYTFNIEHARLLWRSAVPNPVSFTLPSTHPFDAARNADDRLQRFRIEEAALFLQAELNDRPRKARDLITSARDVGISLGTLRRARFLLALRSRKLGGDWSWLLPSQSPPDPPLVPQPPSPTAPPEAPPDPPVTPAPDTSSPRENPQGAQSTRAESKICAPCTAEAPLHPPPARPEAATSALRPAHRPRSPP